MTKYDVKGNIEAEFEPGSNHILKNKLGITKHNDLDEIEYYLQRKMEAWAVENTTENDQLTEKGIKRLHEIWLSPVYEWAGKYRTIEMSKNGFQFAKAIYIPELMKAFEDNMLKIYSPGSKFKDIDSLAEALAKVHIEFILIHPFREGNGRLARVLSDLMVLQAGYPKISYEALSNQKTYINAIQLGVLKQYDKMTALFKVILLDTAK